MSSGIRATVAFAEPETCPIATLSARTGSVISSIATSVPPRGEGEAVSEYYVTVDEPPEEDRVEVLFSYESTHLCRVPHGTRSCPCVSLGSHGIPISRFVASEGAIILVFHAAEYDQLRAVIGTLRDRHESLSLRRLIKAPPAGTPQDTVVVNRGRLTARQLQVLNTAFEHGYFERPRRTNATELAELLHIAPSTVSEHLAAAQSKLFEEVLGDA